MRRTVVSVGFVVVVELVLYVRYAAAGAQFHFWLHGLFGFALGLTVLTVARLLRPRLRLRSPESGLLGQMYSAFPDVLFVSFGLLHVLWMDVFAFHVSLHFVPAPLITMTGVLMLAVGGETASRLGMRKTAAVGIVAAVSVTGAALLLRAPVPDSLRELHQRPGLALVCPLASIDRREP